MGNVPESKPGLLRSNSGRSFLSLAHVKIYYQLLTRKLVFSNNVKPFTHPANNMDQVDSEIKDMV